MPISSLLRNVTFFEAMSHLIVQECCRVCRVRVV